jgi:hypothetical protein
MTLDKGETSMTESNAAISERPRQIVYRTFGERQGPITA